MNSNNPTLIILAVCAALGVYFVFVLIWASRYVKVGPDQALIVSGRQVRTPDGKQVGFRVVTGGGTFVLPVIEKVDTLSLAVFPVELSSVRARTTDASNVQLDCSAQLKIKNDFESIARAAEHFLHKSKTEIQRIIAPILEKSLSEAISTTSLKDLGHNPATATAKIEADATTPLSRVGLTIVSLKIKNLPTPD
jgi:flotillin